MAKKVLPLTDVAVKNAKPQDKAFKLSDGGGLFLEVLPTGGKSWRMEIMPVIHTILGDVFISGLMLYPEPNKIELRRRYSISALSEYIGMLENKLYKCGDEITNIQKVSYFKCTLFDTLIMNIGGYGLLSEMLWNKKYDIAAHEQDRGCAQEEFRNGLGRRYPGIGRSSDVTRQASIVEQARKSTSQNQCGSDLTFGEFAARDKECERQCSRIRSRSQGISR